MVRGRCFFHPMRIRHLVDRFLSTPFSAMHSLFLNGQLQSALVASGLLPQPIPLVNTNANYPPQHHHHLAQHHHHLAQQQQQQQQHVTSNLHQLQFLQQQYYISHNLSFLNSSDFHSTSPPGHPHNKQNNNSNQRGLRTAASESPSLSSSSSSASSSSQPAVCEDIKQVILKQLQIEPTHESGAAAASTSSSDSTVSASDTLHSEEQREEKDTKMSQRGVKRRLGEDEWESKRSRYVVPHRPAPRQLTPYQYQQMTSYINIYFTGHQQREDVFEKKMKLRGALYAIVKGVFPYCGLYVVGSSMNGFGSSSSDMDLCLMLSNAKLDQKREATEILRVLHTALQRCSFLKQLQLIRATVPILKFTDHISKVECDLNVNNPVGIRNTHLLNAYTKMDYRLAPLVMFVKHWAKYHNINDARESTISSYSLAVMVIHFLQYGVDPPVLPCLQQQYPHKFGSEVDVRQLNLNETLPTFNSENTLSLGELFLSFLQYYTKEIDLSECGISIRLGKTISRRALCQTGPAMQWKFLCIEEPYNLSNTARSVHCEYKWQRIMHVFRSSHSILLRTADIRAVVSRPL